MNKTIFFVVAAVMISTAAQAAPRAKSAPAPEQSYSAAGTGSSGRIGLGLSSISTLTGTTGSLTGGMEMGQNGFFQAFLELSTEPAFSFFVTGAYKHTVAGNRQAGFHLGGGAGVGVIAPAAASQPFAFNINALMGVHFPVGVDNIMFHLDGGPVFQLVTGTPSDTSFALQPASGLLGASVLYMF